MNDDYQGKAVLVTGAASGLGRATAIAAAKAGAKVFAVDRDEAGLAATAAEVPGSIETRVADLSDPAACKPVVEDAVAALGRLDLLCNVAGIARMHNVADVTPAEWRQIIDVNLTAPFFMSQAAIPHLLNSEGAIVNVASSASFQGQAYMVPYGASKSAVMGMTQAMAMEFTHAPIRINAVAPSGMNTPMASAGYMEPPEGFDMGLLQRYVGMREKADPATIADFILYVGSNPSFHGACLKIDQGATAG